MHELVCKIGDIIDIGDDITVTVVAIDGDQVCWGIDAPGKVSVSTDDDYESVLIPEHRKH